MRRTLLATPATFTLSLVSLIALTSPVVLGLVVQLTVQDGAEVEELEPETDRRKRKGSSCEVTEADGVL